MRSLSFLSRHYFFRVFNAMMIACLFSLPALSQEPGKHLALVVGISNYKNYALLDYAGDDAIKVREALKGQGYEIASLTTDAHAGSVSQSALLEALKELLLNRNPQDTVLVYFAGHGSLRNGKQYLLCTDTDPNNFEATAFSLDALGELLKNCRAQNRLLIIDACRDTSRADGVPGFGDGQLNRSFKDRLDGVVRQAPPNLHVASAVLYACRAGQRSKESDMEKAGDITLRLVNALSSHTGESLTVGSLNSLIGSQMPDFLKGIQDPDISGDANVLVAAANPDLERGLRLDSNAQYSEAFPLLKPFAERGNTRVQITVGYMFGHGQGVEKDEREAVRWYRKAAEAGDAHGMSNLGYMYDNGLGGLEKDTKEALRWYRKAAEVGDAGGMNNLGLMYESGHGGLEKDEKEAVRWYRKAAEAGNTNGMSNLGAMYDTGRGVEKDEKEALRWYRKAAEAGDARGMNNLGVMYENGQGGLEKDEKEAVRWYQKAAEAGEAFGMNNLGHMYENGRGGLEKDVQEAVRWYRKAADAGNTTAKANLKRLGQ